MEPETPGSVRRRHRRTLFEIGAELGLALSFAASVIISAQFAGPNAALIVKSGGLLLPVATLTAWFGFYAQRIRSMDEFEQAMATRALAISCGLTVWITSIWGLAAAIFAIPALSLAMVAPMGAIIYAGTRSILSSVYT